MASERHDGPTPAGGDHSVAVYVNLRTLRETTKARATGVVITEYDANGYQIAETVAAYSEPAPAA